MRFFKYHIVNSIIFIISFCLSYSVLLADITKSSVDMPQDQIIIQFTSDISFDASLKCGFSPIDSLNTYYKIFKIEKLFTATKNISSLANIYKFYFLKKSDLKKLIKNYQQIPQVIFVEQNVYYYADGKKNNDTSWGIEKIQLKKLKHVTNFVIIGLIDTGIDWNHTGLKNNIWTNVNENANGLDDDNNGFIDDIHGWNFIDYTNNALDNVGHGTQIAGIICAFADSACKIMSLKTGFKNYNGRIIFRADNCAKAILYAIQNGAHVIHLSWSGYNYSHLLKLIIDYAYSKNCLIIASAGNENHFLPKFPAAYKNVLAVTATDREDKKWTLSNFGSWIDISAPGFKIFTTDLDNKYCFKSGTSLAAAHVSGLAALLIAYDGHLSNDSLKKRIIWSADNILADNPNFEGMMGAGRINIANALNSRYQPNVVLQRISYHRHPKNNIININENDSIDIQVSLINLSYNAKNISLNLDYDNTYLSIKNPRILISELKYKDKITKEFVAEINKNSPHDYSTNINYTITTESGFRNSKSYPIAISSIINTIANEIDGELNPEKSYFPTDNKEIGENKKTYNFDSFSPDTTINQAPRLVAFSPSQDTAVAQEDTLMLSVQVSDEDGDSLFYQWFINGRLAADDDDSAFVYTAGLDATTDTITVTVSSVGSDSVVSNSWFITTISSNQAPRLVAFSPSQDTAVAQGDTLMLSVQVSDEDGDSLFYQWFVNNKLLNGNNDSLFLYKAPNSSALSVDTISVVILDKETFITAQWIITVINDFQLQTLPTPELIFPVHGNSICEDDYFIWSIDSLSFLQDSAITFIIQIAKDSLFSQISCTDTCLSDTSIKMSEISGFENIKVNGNYYWRVKSSITGEKESKFAESNHAFSYLPLFVELVNFYAEKDEEGKIILSWQTSFEQNNLGFNVYRGISSDGNFIKINERLITGKNYYSYIDRTIKYGQTYYYKLEDVSIRGKTKFHPSISIKTPLPQKYELTQNYPNPFNTVTVFKYQIPVETHVVIQIFNVLGRKIRTIIDEKKEPGFYTVNWDGLDSDGEPVVSGIYFYQLQTNSFKATRKMTIVR